MTDEEKGGNGNDGGARQEPRSSKAKMRDGIKDGLGVLSAFKEALEETINEARERGDLSADRAKVVMKETLDKAQTAAEGARDRLDFATQNEVEAMKSAVDSINERVKALEESVFGPGGTDEEKTDGAEGPGSQAGGDEKS